MGAAKVDLVERMLAKHGLLLKGGDPAIIERVKAEENERRRVREEIQEALEQGEVTSDNLFEEACDELIAIARSVIQDGALLMNSAAKMLARQNGDGRRSRTYYVSILKRYAMSASRSRCGDVGRLIAPVIALDAAERAERKKGSCKKPAPKGRERLRDFGDKHPNVVDLRKTATA